jgi:hypothetical protein
LSASGVIVVDVANVMGSRPDGWWHDRAGAARRLHEQVLAAGLDGVVFVVEGVSRAGVEAGQVGGVRVVHAAGSGDDAIVDAAAEAARDDPDCGQALTVVTSDRDLRRRVVELGAEVVGPRWLLEQLG